MKKTPLVGKNEYLLNSKANLVFEDILRMSDANFNKWVKFLAKEIVHAWDKLGLPPKNGVSKDDIVSQFKRLADLNVSDFLQENELTLEQNCVVNNHTTLASGCNSFFPDMGRTKDIDTLNLTGNSIYDLFADFNNLKLITGELKRHFKEDSFYCFSKVVLKENNSFLISESNGKRWIEKFSVERSEPYSNYDFWIDKKASGSRSKKGSHLSLSKKDIDDLLKRKIISNYHFPNCDPKENDSDQRFRIRLYKKGQKILPAGFRFFQSGTIMAGTNFPPATAKYIYSTFTKDIKKQKEINVLDPSAGFGGRLLGALSMNTEKQIHYVGTDPNPSNWLEDFNKTRYEYLGDFFNSNITRKHRTTYDIFKLGSEVIHKNKGFQKYKGKFDLVFTSPPYFASEGYSEDPNQSYKKFPTYSEWRNGFLKPTLKTCVEYLKPKRWLLFNITDTKIGGKYYPLERDTEDILLSLGMKYKKKLMMVLSMSPGGNRTSSRTGYPTTLNSCQINGSRRKYEPIMCFWKP